MHVIRLHGPWTIESAGQQHRRVHLPREWSLVGEAARDGVASLSRRFHRPTGLTEQTRVALALPAGWPVATLTINGQAIRGEIQDERQTYDLSRVIHSREAHDLWIEFETGDQLLSQPYSVALEILDSGERGA